MMFFYFKKSCSWRRLIVQSWIKLYFLQIKSNIYFALPAATKKYLKKLLILIPNFNIFFLYFIIILLFIFYLLQLFGNWISTVYEICSVPCAPIVFFCQRAFIYFKAMTINCRYEHQGGVHLGGQHRHLLVQPGCQPFLLKVWSFCIF